MALMHLILTEENHSRLINKSNQPLPYSYDVDILELNQNRNLIMHSSDIILPEFLLINMNVQPAENTLDYILDNYSLIFTFGNNNKPIPLRFLDYLQKSQITSRNILKIAINFKYFFNYNDGMPMFCIPYNDAHCGIKNNDNNRILEGASLVSKKKYISKPERFSLVELSHHGGTGINGIKSRELNTIDIESTTNILENVSLTGQGYTNGFILQITKNKRLEQVENIQPTINNIENICYKTNNIERHNFNANLIDLYCQKLSDNAIYFPLNLDTDLLS